jgi:hypothetical protein
VIVLLAQGPLGAARGKIRDLLETCFCVVNKQGFFFLHLKKVVGGKLERVYAMDHLWTTN